MQLSCCLKYSLKLFYFYALQIIINLEVFIDIVYFMPTIIFFYQPMASKWLLIVHTGAIWL